MRRPRWWGRIPKLPAIIGGNQAAGHSALLALIFLNPPLVLNHLVQYEGIVNVPLCC
jgi:hypothetical protein